MAAPAETSCVMYRTAPNADGVWYELTYLLFGYRIHRTDGESVFEIWDYDGKDAHMPALLSLMEVSQGRVDEPEGWIRAKTKGANGGWIMWRRRPEGDPAKEYVGP